MTYTTQEALRLAEEAFMKIADLRNLGKINPEVIAFETLYFIRAAKAQEQAEQEPVGWYSHKGGFNECGEGQPLYTAPVRTKNLTDDEIDAIDCSYEPNKYDMRDFARAVIAKFKEKNK